MEIKRIKTEEEFDQFAEVLGRIHCDSFSRAPWHFSLNLEESIRFLSSHFGVDERIFVVGFEAGKVIGAALASPLYFHYDIARLVDPEIVPVTVYLTRIFVDKKFQGKGFGQTLHEARLNYAKENAFKFALHRTIAGTRMHRIVQRGGFEKIGQMPVLERCETNLGTYIYRNDLRVLSLKEL
jgi:GNAT superfamily N-acetyltransferase